MHRLTSVIFASLFVHSLCLAQQACSNGFVLKKRLGLASIVNYLVGDPVGVATTNTPTTTIAAGVYTTARVTPTTAVASTTSISSVNPVLSTTAVTSNVLISSTTSVLPTTTSASPFVPITTSSVAPSITPTVSTVNTSSTVSASAARYSHASSNHSRSSNGKSAGTIVSTLIAGMAGLIVVGLGIIYYRRRRANPPQKAMHPWSERNADSGLGGESSSTHRVIGNVGRHQTPFEAYLENCRMEEAAAQSKNTTSIEKSVPSPSSPAPKDVYVTALDGSANRWANGQGREQRQRSLHVGDARFVMDPMPPLLSPQFPHSSASSPSNIRFPTPSRTPCGESVDHLSPHENSMSESPQRWHRSIQDLPYDVARRAFPQPAVVASIPPPNFMSASVLASMPVPANACLPPLQLGLTPNVWIPGSPANVYPDSQYTQGGTAPVAIEFVAPERSASSAHTHHNQAKQVSSVGGELPYM